MGDKAQLHNSMLDMMARCGIQFQRRYGARFGIWGQEEIIPPGVALAVGISVHKAVEKNLTEKLKTGDLMHFKAVQEIAHMALDDIWNEGMLLSEDEAINPAKTRGAATDQAVILSLLHHSELAAQVNPQAIEEKFVIELDGYPIDLAGKKDIVEEDKIGDVKTMAQNKASVRSMQMAMYALDHKIKRGKMPASVYHHKLIKTKTPKAIIEEIVPEQSWIDPLMRRIERFVEIIDAVRSGKGALMPADPSSWVCSARYCGYARSCKWWSGN